MYDALIELTELSCVLQDWNTAIDKAERTIRRTIYRFTIMKDKLRTQMLKAMMSIKDMQHGSVPLNNETRHVHFNHRQFLSSLIDNMNARLFKFQTIRTRGKNNFLDEVKILDCSSWPV